MIYVFLASGFEEIEALAPVDCLRRAGYDVKIVGVGAEAIRGSHDIVVGADLTADEILLDDSLEMIILPGGMPGTLNLEASAQVQKAISFCIEHDKFIGAICAAPSILGHLGLLDGKNATCYAGFETQLGSANATGAPVEVAGKIITARGAGVAVEFALTLVGCLKGETAQQKMTEALMCR